MSRPIPRIAVIYLALGGLVGGLMAWLGSITVGIVAALVLWILGLLVAWLATRPDGAGEDPGRRRFLVFAGLGSLVWAAAGTAAGKAVRAAGMADATAAQDEMASSLGAEYMEFVRRTYRPGRSGDLQLLLAPFNSANYAPESLSLVPNDPRTSHASVWMYLERVPLVAYAPGRITPGDSSARVSLADLAPTTAGLIGLDDWPKDHDGRPLTGVLPLTKPPKVVVTFVIDGGGWNVLQQWPDAWPTLRRLMRGGMTFRNATTGSFPAVTACAHATIGTGTFPHQHGITGHNVRDGSEVRKAYRTPGQADPGDILVPTLADLWSDSTSNEAWVGEIGYQVWHLGMLGYGGRDRPSSAKPVGVFWDEDGSQQWQPHNPDLYRLPAITPGLDVLARHQSEFTSPDWDSQFTPQGRQSPCCSPPMVRYQGDLIEAAFDAEPIGQGDATSLVYINYKSPDYTGHIYNMLSQWEELQLQEVDAQLGRLSHLLENRFPGEYVLFVTADHGQCPTPDAVDGVRLDPIQLQSVIEQRFGGLHTVVQSVVPSEVYLYPDELADAGADVNDVAAYLRDLTYRQTIGPYVPRDAIERDLLDAKQFAAVFSTPYLDTLADADLALFGETRYTGDGVDPGVPPAI